MRYLFAGVVAAALVVSCALAPAGSAAGPVTLRTGDRLVVAGSKLQCAVSTESSASHPPTLVCGVGDVQSPLPGTYALAFADEAVLVIKSSASRQPVLVTRKAQPSAPSGVPAVSRKATTITVRSGALLLLGGSDILCSVSPQDGTPTLACGLAAGGSGTFVVGSYVGVISQKVALLTRLLAGDKLDPVVSEKQPAH